MHVCSSHLFWYARLYLFIYCSGGQHSSSSSSIVREGVLPRVSHVSEGQPKAKFPSSSSLANPKSSPAVPFRPPLVKPARISRMNFLVFEDCATRARSSLLRVCSAFVFLGYGVYHSAIRGFLVREDWDGCDAPFCILAQYLFFPFVIPRRETNARHYFRILAQSTWPGVSRTVLF